MSTKLFPCILMILDVAAAAVYLSQGDYRRMTYWGAAAVLTFTVTV